MKRFSAVILTGFVVLLAADVYGQSPAYFMQQNQNTFSIELDQCSATSMLRVPASGASDHFSLAETRWDTLIVISSADCYVDRDAPSSNFGGLSYLDVDGRGWISRGRFNNPWWGFKRAAFIRFEVPPIKGKVVKAELHLYCVSGGYGGGVYYFNPNEDILNWQEHLVTWNERPTGLSEQGEPGTFTDYMLHPISSGWHAFDVTRSFLHELPSYSFAVVMRENSPTQWASRESSHPPKLFIFYQPPPDSVTYSGHVYYYDQSVPVPRTKISLSDTAVISFDSTNALGAYRVSAKIDTGKATLRAEKAPHSDIPPLTIIAYDAALVARAATGLGQLSHYQRIAADVDLDGRILLYDAALIARYAVGLPEPSGGKTGYWVFDPPEYTVPMDVSGLDTLNFTAILLGNVHGGWQPVKKPKFAERSIFTTVQIDGDTVLIGWSTRLKKKIQAFDLAMDLRTLPLRYLGSNLVQADSTFTLVENAGKGRARIAAYSVSGAEIDGRFLQSVFVGWNQVQKTQDERLSLFVPYLVLNDEVFPPFEICLGLERNENTRDTILLPGYPNPFNQSVTLEFDASEPGSLLAKIYNVEGQMVKKIQLRIAKAGRHFLAWDGTDRIGNTVPSGVYFLQLRFNGQVFLQKLLLIR